MGRLHDIHQNASTVTCAYKDYADANANRATR